MAVFAQDFTFNETSLSTFAAGYRLVDFDDEETSTPFTRSFQQSDITNDNSMVYFYDAVGTSPLEFDITICRADFEDMRPANIKELADWLLGTKVPCECYFTSCIGESAVYDNTYFIGGFTQMTYTKVGNRILGVSFHFVNNSPYGYTGEYTYAISGNTLITNPGSRTGEYIYPIITISPTGTGNVTINNLDDTSVDAFSLTATLGTTLIIDDRNIYTETGDLYDFNCLNNFYWPALVDGDNHIVVTGQATVTMKTRFYKNLGV